MMIIIKRTFEMTSHNINLNKWAPHTFSMKNLLLIHIIARAHNKNDV